MLWTNPTGLAVAAGIAEPAPDARASITIGEGFLRQHDSNGPISFSLRRERLLSNARTQDLSLMVNVSFTAATVVIGPPRRVP
jgi:hypothetical protein